MIHGGGSEVARSGLEKLIISRKLKSSLGRRGGNARLFLFGVALPSPPLPSLPPSLLPLSHSSSRSPGNGRNFKRKFTNEGDFPSPPPTIQRPTLGCNAEGKGGKSRHAVVFRAFSTPASTRSTRGRPPLFSSISLSLSLALLFSLFFADSSRSFNGDLGRGREGGEADGVHQKREHPPREEMRFSSGTRAFQSALSCPRCARFDPPSRLLYSPLLPIFHAPQETAVWIASTKRVDFLSPLDSRGGEKKRKTRDSCG